MTDTTARRFRFRIMLFVSWLILAWFGLRLSPLWELGLDIELWGAHLESLEPGFMVYAGFVAVYILGVLICFPTATLGIASGFLFGTWTALGLVILACALGATAGFWIGHFIGRDFMEEQARGLVRKLDEFIAGMGWTAVLTARLAFVPFAPSNYICGALKVSYGHFIVGTVLGVIPGSFAACYLGSGLEILAVHEGGIPWVPVLLRLVLAVGIIVWSLKSDRIARLRQKVTE